VNKEELEQRIRDANKAYWIDGDPQITDQEYDQLVEALRKIDPQNELITKIADVPNIKNKVIHKKPMLSLAKAYSLEEVMKFCGKTSRTKDEIWLIQPKYDGLSGKWEDGVLSSRGTGTVGENYTDRLPIITFIGGSPDEEDMLGEIVITDEDWKWMQSHGVKGKSRNVFKNQRNAVAGIIGTDDAAKIYKDVDEQMENEGYSLITFVRYGTHSWEMKLTDIEKNWNNVVKKIEQLGFPIDGVVIKLKDEKYAESLGATDHHPRGAIAFKFTNQSKWSKLIGIQWTMGKQQLACIGQIDPVDISGTTVQNVKLQLTAPKSSDVTTYLMDGSLQIGDEVLIERCGDIIPHVKESRPGKTRTRIELNECPFCGGKLKFNESSIECTNPNCRRKEVEKLIFAMITLDFKGVGGKYAELLHDILGIKTVKDLLTIDEESLRSHREFGDKMVDIFMKEQAKAKEAGFQKILVAMDVQGIGKNVAKLLDENFSREDIVNCNITKAQMLAINGIGQVAAEETLKGLKERADEIKWAYETFGKEETTPEAPTNGEWIDVCFTGKMSRTRSEMEALANAHGMIAMSDVSTHTKFLVCADPSSNSGKMKKARKMGIKVISEAEFFKLIGQ